MLSLVLVLWCRAHLQRLESRPSTSQSDLWPLQSGVLLKWVKYLMIKTCVIAVITVLFLWVRSLAAEWGCYGHRFNIIQPGPIKTKVPLIWSQLLVLVYVLLVVGCCCCWLFGFRGHSAVSTQLEHLRKQWLIGFQQVDLENQQRSQTWQRTWAATLLPGCLELWVCTDPGSEFRLIQRNFHWSSPL